MVSRLARTPTRGGSRRNEFDVAVVGAGPAGSATARRLAQTGCRVVLLERSRFDAPRVGESLAPATNGLLRELGVWPQFAALGALPSCGTRSMWGSSQPGTASYLAHPYGCGWHVDRVALDRMLAEAAVDAGVELRCATTCVRAEYDHRWSLSLVEEHRSVAEPVYARVLVDATGRTARLGRRLGARQVVFDRLVGVAALVGAVDVSAEGYVCVETTPDGWWYSAPTAPGRMIGMLLTDADLCRSLRVSTPQRWYELLATANTTAARVAGSMPDGRRRRDHRPSAPPEAHNPGLLWGPRVFAAFSQRLCRTTADIPWLAVGDAALAVDPISGSGVVRALRTAQAATTTVLALLANDVERPIAAYEADRDRECADYLRERALYYSAERRWLGMPFWQRRTRFG